MTGQPVLFCMFDFLIRLYLMPADQLQRVLFQVRCSSSALASHSEASAYVSLGSRIAGSTPGSSVGTSKLKCGIVFVGASRIAPLKIASMIPRVSLMEIRFPVPFHPVFTRYAFAPLSFILLTSSSAYLALLHILSDAAQGMPVRSMRRMSVSAL